MRRALIATIIALSLTAAACSPYDTPADATPAPPPAACDRACWEAVVERQEAERIWWAEVVAQQRRRAEAARIARIYAFAHAVEQARLQATRYRPGQCGGSLPPCYVMMRESRGNIRAANPRSSARGKWQFLRSTWANFGGYPSADLAPEQVQDAKARQLWNGGRGCSHWSACG